MTKITGAYSGCDRNKYCDQYRFSKGTKTQAWLMYTLEYYTEAAVSAAYVVAMSLCMVLMHCMHQNSQTAKSYS